MKETAEFIQEQKIRSGKTIKHFLAVCAKGDKKKICYPLYIK